MISSQELSNINFSSKPNYLDGLGKKRVAFRGSRNSFELIVVPPTKDSILVNGEKDMSN